MAENASAACMSEAIEDGDGPKPGRIMDRSEDG